MENKEILEAISRRLGVLIALQMKAQSENFSTTEGVEMLSHFGMGNTEIAEILSTSPGTVNVIKNRIKNKKK
jgi:DNA-binding NarL/FixJ family response regulator